MVPTLRLVASYQSHVILATNKDVGLILNVGPMSRIPYIHIGLQMADMDIGLQMPDAHNKISVSKTFCIAFNTLS